MKDSAFRTGEVAKFIDGHFEAPSHRSREMPVWGDHFGMGIPEVVVSESITRSKKAASR
jgi:hypothetical protein